MASDTLTLAGMNRATLARQLLLDRATLTPLKAIERLIALQAQWPRPPFVGLWTRLKDFDRGSLVSEFQRRRVVRATLLRGTIHVATSADFAAFRPVMHPGLDAGLRAILRDRLAGTDLDALIATARRLLATQPMTFEDLRQAFLDADPKADERAMGYSVRMLVPLVQVPEEDTTWAFPAKARFALADAWLKRDVPTAPAPADELARRYLAGYGPSSAADFQAWSGLPAPLVRETLDRLRPSLKTFKGPGTKELFDLPAAPRPDPETPAPVRFLPEYDNVIGTRADERFVARADRPRVFLSALRLAATVLVDGRVAGTWSIATTKKGATLTVTPFRPLAAKARAEVEAEGRALLLFSEPDARSHDVSIPRK